jgi:hypothetical protein
MSTATGRTRRPRRARGRAVPAAVPAVLLSAGLLLAGCAGDDAPEGPATGATTAAPDASGSPAATAVPSVSATGPATTTAADPTATPGAGPAPTSGPTRALAGGLVEGFPTDLVPVPVGAEVTASSVVEGEGTRQVSLSGRSDTAAAELLSFWRGALTAQGFTELPGNAPEGTVRATFVRGGGAELLDVSVLSGEGGQTFTVGGQIAG